ncbi:hypothetical protein [Agromyces laixinhei]|uniref:hypothetical protein n=1 Tax=Agromyces laixinhei TaxID=2585717 RepID=UPI001116A04F|nr:hypothetical protein [Agromyces laixinhei]
MTAIRPIAAASLALFALLLTGCASGASSADSAAEPKSDSKSDSKSESKPAADQSAAEACDLMKGSLDELVALASGENAAALSGDPSAAVAALKTTEVSMRDAAAQVTNADVTDAANGAAAAMTGYVAFLDSVVADPANADMTKMTEQATSLQAGIAGLSEACAA